MPVRIVIQPNGLFARFSTVVDHFTDVNMSRHEAWELMRDEFRSDAVAIIKVENAEHNPARFEEAIAAIAAIHGQRAADLAKSETCMGIEAVNRSRQ